MHNGMVRFGEEKMAKSVGNIRTLADTLDEYGRDALIIYFLGGHYRQPLAFSAASLEQAQRSIERIVNFRACSIALQRRRRDGEPDPALAERRDAFFAALRDDFNTPQALAALFDFISEGNRRLEAGERPAGAESMLSEMLRVIGLETLLGADQPLDEEAVRLADEREQARRAGDFARADLLRDRLAALGYEVRDTAAGPELVRSSDPAAG